MQSPQLFAKNQGKHDAIAPFICKIEGKEMQSSQLFAKKREERFNCPVYLQNRGQGDAITSFICKIKARRCNCPIYLLN